MTRRPFHPARPKTIKPKPAAHPGLRILLMTGYAEQRERADDLMQKIVDVVPKPFALPDIRRAVALRPEDGYITDSLGWVLYRLGNYEEAVPHLERAVELLPYDSVINDHLGDAYWRVGRRLEARFQWMRAKNHSDDEILVGEIDRKLDQGLQSVDIVKEASSQASGINILKP